MHASTACEPQRAAGPRIQPGCRPLNCPFTPPFTPPFSHPRTDRRTRPGVPGDGRCDDRCRAPVRPRSRGLRAVAAGLLLLATALAQAHKSSDAYLFFDQQADRTSLRWDIALRDLDVALVLDADGNRELTWGEVRAAWPRIDALALQSLAVPGCSFGVDGHALEQRNDGLYAVLQLSAPCRLPAQAALRYSLFGDIDTTHRGIVRHTVAGSAATVRMLVPQVMPAAMPAAMAGAMAVAAPDVARPVAAGQAPDKPQPLSVDAPARVVLDKAGAQAPATEAAVAAAVTAAAATPAAATPAAATPADATPADPHAASFIREGVHHIVTGYDHLLFLLCLLLPAVLWRSPGPPARWQAVAGWRQALGPVAKTVTLFTLAHSVTLALAALGWVRLAPSVVEPAIAATIMLAAVDNLRPLLLRWRGAVTFGFGLIHGFGFAGVLGELQLPAAQFGWALFQFNLGLELGQLVLVATVVPLLFMLRHRRAYVPLVLRAGSVGALALAALWLVERTADWTGLGV